MAWSRAQRSTGSGRTSRCSCTSTRSCVTVKADAARRSFNAYGRPDRLGRRRQRDLGRPPALRRVPHARPPGRRATCTASSRPTATPAPRTARWPTRPATARTSPGIIAGAIDPWLDRGPGGRSVRVTENRYNVENPREPLRVPRDASRDASRCWPGWRRGPGWSASRCSAPAATADDRVSRRDRGAGLRPRGQRRGRRRDAHPRRQPQRRLRVRPGVVRLRAEPAVQGGRQAGPLGRRGRGRGRQLRLRHAGPPRWTRRTSSASA